MNPLSVETRRETADDTPVDGYGPGFLVYRMSQDFHELCCRIGKENARQEIAEVINSECERKKQ